MLPRAEEELQPDGEGVRSQSGAGLWIRRLRQAHMLESLVGLAEALRFHLGFKFAGPRFGFVQMFLVICHWLNPLLR
jgi:hypothetical protein